MAEPCVYFLPQTNLEVVRSTSILLSHGVVRYLLYAMTSSRNPRLLWYYTLLYKQPSHQSTDHSSLFNTPQPQQLLFVKSRHPESAHVSFFTSSMAAILSATEDYSRCWEDLQRDIQWQGTPPDVDTRPDRVTLGTILTWQSLEPGRHSLVGTEWMNEFYNLYPARETRGSSPGVYSPAVDGN